ITLTTLCFKGRDKDSGHTPFWEAVVITTADEDQKQGFQLQIKAKHERKELPSNLEIHVISDPPGVKLGNGGATFTALSFLQEFYGEKFLSMKILLIHAGGLSKRLPSHSVLGKIFSTLPCGSPCYQMLDVKLALFWPFIEKMKPGIFLTCADDIITYSLSDLDWSLESEAFTALAHPSPVKIGTSHGVYIVKDKTCVNDRVQLAKCQTVLQKPSVEMMTKLGAMVTSQKGSKEPVVYTDSAFFFTSSVSKIFLNFINNHGPFNCEIDAYGDFLQALGSDPQEDYVENLKNITTASGDLLHTRKELFQLLKGSPLDLVVLNNSSFFHIGTMPEMLHNYCENDYFKTTFGLSSDAFSVWLDDQPEHGEPVRKKSHIKGKNHGCLIHSVLCLGSCISSLALVEFCHFEWPVSVSKNCLLSNCELVHSTPVKQSPVIVPENTFMHTVPVIIEGNLKHVTMVFHVNDNLKQSVVVKDLGTIPFLGGTLGNAIEKFKISNFKIVPDTNRTEVSLWDINIFPVTDTMSDSFLLGLAMSRCFEPEESIINLASYQLVSVSSVLKHKAVKEMVEYRQKLFDTINTHH
ncbi:fucose-1-phosphate guanylyltransferase-like, partial [Argonauta hians]